MLTDKKLVDYVDTHSRTGRPLFSAEDCKRFLELAGKKVPKDFPTKGFHEMAHPDIKDLLSIAQEKVRVQELQETKPQAGARQLILGNQTWWWFCGKRASTVVIWDPKGKKHVCHGRDVTGNDTERGQWKRSSDGMVTPSAVKQFITSKLVTR